jgi:hypothetical protein
LVEQWTENPCVGGSIPPHTTINLFGMRDIFNFLFGIVAVKLIEDNLPNFHYKKIIAAFNKHIMPLLLLSALGYYSLLSKVSRNKDVQKTHMTLLTIIIATIVLQKISEQNKKLATN